ncbi:hypothetical protein Q6348_02635 [Isoptericola sp. b441]|uniref:Uncharacterized protein n=1 Tax=Actinotalea lenta TaxID=3064654 RepID=A0ABT9D6F6_9CELL|nr:MULTISPECIES: hypothetical protein [unclassified Isoptericola]MDO8106090.1 hypothetical protein [Isoptericola sp. b441]MDO8122191.1 hypothetical protein [Isoptericola sp. b490]
MPENGFTGTQSSFDEITAGLHDLSVPPATLARWAAMAGQLATAGYVPRQPAA